MAHILTLFPWNIQRKIIECIHSPMRIELKEKYTHRKLSYIAILRDNGEFKYAKFVNDAFKFREVAYIKEIEWNWYEWGLRKVYNGECPWLQIIPTQHTFTFIEWLKKVAKFKRVKYGITSLTDYVNMHEL